MLRVLISHLSSFLPVGCLTYVSSRLALDEDGCAYLKNDPVCSHFGFFRSPFSFGVSDTGDCNFFPLSF